MRRNFTAHQIQVLDGHYGTWPFPSKDHRQALAFYLDIPEVSIKVESFCTPSRVFFDLNCGVFADVVPESTPQGPPEGQSPPQLDGGGGGGGVPEPGPIDVQLHRNVSLSCSISLERVFVVTSTSKKEPCPLQVRRHLAADADRRRRRQRDAGDAGADSQRVDLLPVVPAGVVDGRWRRRAGPARNSTAAVPAGWRTFQKSIQFHSSSLIDCLLI